MNLHSLLSTKERLKILSHVIYQNKPFTINRTANKLKLSKGLISKYFHILLKERVLQKSSHGFFVRETPLTKSLKIFLNLNTLDFSSIFKKHRFVKAAGLYGSLAKGTNTMESDIDLWVLTEDVEEEKIAKLTNEVKRKSNKIKPVYLTREKLIEMRKKDPVFYYALVFGSISIYGEEIEAV